MAWEEDITPTPVTFVAVDSTGKPVAGGAPQVQLSGSNLQQAHAVTPSLDELSGVGANGSARFAYVGVPGDLVITNGDAITVRDTFTGANGTGLASHDPEAGGPWTVHSGSWAIQDNAASPTGSGLATIDAGVSDLLLQGTLQSAEGQALAFRVADASNLWFARVSGTSLQLYEIAAGTASQRAIAVVGGDAPFTVKVECSGEDIVVTSNGVTITYSSSAGASNTLVGVRASGSGHAVGDLIVADPSLALRFKNLAAGAWHPTNEYRYVLPNSTATDILAGY